MMSEIQAGEGYRLLGSGEELRQGDELLTSEGWMVIPSMFIGERVNDLSSFRRRIPAKPEAMEIGDRTFKCNSFDEVITRDDIGDRRKLVSSPEQARQLADWLTRYADWREAQDSK
jgi:hypothetical protein